MLNIVKKSTEELHTLHRGTMQTRRVPLALNIQKCDEAGTLDDTVEWTSTENVNSCVLRHSIQDFN